MTAAFHHIELWTTDVTAVEGGWHWLLINLGWKVGDGWEGARLWTHADGTYLVLEQSPDLAGPHNRTHAGLNHLAFLVTDQGLLNSLRAEASGYGWVELFAERFTHAGGTESEALYLENCEGFEVEMQVVKAAITNGQSTMEP